MAAPEAAQGSLTLKVAFSGGSSRRPQELAESGQSGPALTSVRAAVGRLYGLSSEEVDALALQYADDEGNPHELTDETLTTALWLASRYGHELRLLCTPGRLEGPPATPKGPTYLAPLPTTRLLATSHALAPVRPQEAVRPAGTAEPAEVKQRTKDREDDGSEAGDAASTASADRAESSHAAGGSEADDAGPVHGQHNVNLSGKALIPKAREVPEPEGLQADAGAAGAEEAAAGQATASQVQICKAEAEVQWGTSSEEQWTDEEWEQWWAHWSDSEWQEWWEIQETWYGGSQDKAEIQAKKAVAGAEAGEANVHEADAGAARVSRAEAAAGALAAAPPVESSQEGGGERAGSSHEPSQQEDEHEARQCHRLDGTVFMPEEGPHVVKDLHEDDAKARECFRMD